MDAFEAYKLFMMLDIRTHPDVTIVSKVIAYVLFWILLGVTGALLLLSIASYITSSSSLRRYRGAGFTSSILFCCLITFIFFPVNGKGRGVSVFEVAPRQQVGMYDVRVIKSTSAAELIRWLRDNRFEFNNADSKAFNGYIKKGWCFVVARVNPAGRNEGAGLIRESLLPPLILRFPVKAPVYPLTLTGTAGMETEVLLYLAGISKMNCGKRMKLLYAGMGKMESVALTLQRCVEPKDFFKDIDKERLKYLCKFKKTLTPEDMTTDLVFSPAPDNMPYRQHIIKW